MLLPVSVSAHDAQDRRSVYVSGKPLTRQQQAAEDKFGAITVEEDALSPNREEGQYRGTKRGREGGLAGRRGRLHRF
jgi:hypothetical protein